MFISLIKFDLASALYYNGAFLFLIPIWLGLAISYFTEYIKNGNKKPPKYAKNILYSTVAIMLVFSILRNIINIGLCPNF